MVEKVVTATTTFYSQDDFVNFEHPGVLDPNLKFNFLSRNGQYYLQYGKDDVAHFSFDNPIDFVEDYVGWEEQLDTTTNKFKFRLDIKNAYRGDPSVMPPVDIWIRPDGYDPAWQLVYKYKKMEIAGREQNVIEISRLEGRTFFLVDTVQATDLKWRGVLWLQERKPIVMHKHATYITIRASAHLARLAIFRHHTFSWSDPDRTFEYYKMSPQETAWISPDQDFYTGKLTKHTTLAHAKRRLLTDQIDVFCFEYETCTPKEKFLKQSIQTVLMMKRLLRDDPTNTKAMKELIQELNLKVDQQNKNFKDRNSAYFEYAGKTENIMDVLNLLQAQLQEVVLHSDERCAGGSGASAFFEQTANMSELLRALQTLL